LGACNNTTVEPITPPESITITSTAVEVTATTAVITTTVTTNKTVTVSVEYGAFDYTNQTDATPNPVSGNNTVSAKLSELSPNTVYKYRIKTVGENTNYFDNSSTFTTSSQLQIGDSYKDGIIIYVHSINGVQHGLVAAIVDQTQKGFGQNPPNYGGANFVQAQQLCANYFYYRAVYFTFPFFKRIYF
jgi:hypothetical protein